jgi:hypothetical protein
VGLAGGFGRGTGRGAKRVASYAMDLAAMGEGQPIAPSGCGTTGPDEAEHSSDPLRVSVAFDWLRQILIVMW